MSDITSYILILGLFVIGGYSTILLAQAILLLFYQDQAILMAYPFF